jgi:putative transposase
MAKSRTKRVEGVAGVVEDRQFSIKVPGIMRDLRDGFEALCLKAGLQVFEAMVEDDLLGLCGPKGVPDEGRKAYRHGSTKGSIVFGGQTLQVRRPRVRSVANEELGLESFEWASCQDPLDRATLEAVCSNVSMRRYEGLQPDVGSMGRSKSKSSVSRRFVTLTSKQVDEWMRRSLVDVDVPVIMVDGIYFADHVVLIAMGIDRHGAKHILGLREGATENTIVVRELLADLVERGLQAHTPRLWVIDGAKALRRAIKTVFGEMAFIQRCQEHKRRNVLEHLPKTHHASVSKALRDAWASPNPQTAQRQLERLAGRLEREHPSAAASLREGMAETLTAQKLGVTDALLLTLRSTNPIENLNSLIARYARNVKRWQSGSMVLRWVAGALTDAGQSFRKIKGYRDIHKLADQMQRHLSGHQQKTHSKAA